MDHFLHPLDRMGHSREKGRQKVSEKYPVYPYYEVETECSERPIAFPPQHQERQPGLEWPMEPRPIYNNPRYCGSGKLKDQVAIITGGDSGIGRAIAVAFAKEGADVVIAYLYEEDDAAETVRAVRAVQEGRHCLAIAGDLRDPAHHERVVAETIKRFGRLDVVINNIGVQFPQKRFEDISPAQLEDTYRTNIFSFFYMTWAALPHLQPGSRIVNTASITAFEGAPILIDYSSTKGAIVSFTRSLALNLVKRCIRVNAVAPGPVWTPLIVSSYDNEEIMHFGTDTPIRRAAQPFELAPAYVYLASDDSGDVTGQVLHVNGGKYLGG
jgi:NAD(P)-dependent dehydrogenase (short-subunit alcohol dehydrogenase family)